jgi:hypothetical protein
VAGLVSLASYDIIDVERLRHAYEPSVEHAVWYQHPFQTGRGRDCLASHRRELCRMLWRQWSPDWRFDEVTFERTAGSLKPGGTADQADMFTGRHEHRVIDAGHNLPQEAPAACADAVLTVRKWLQPSA